jgi:hypothetical protein
MISELVSSAVDLGFEPPLGQTKTLKLVFAVFLVNTQHLGVRVKDCLARNQDNVSEKSNMSTRITAAHYFNLVHDYHLQFHYLLVQFVSET